MIRTYDLDPFFDGVTHINVYSKGITELGRMLSNFYNSPFVMEEYGLFESVEGFWYWWFKGRDESLRSMSGLVAKKYGQSIKKNYVVKEPDKQVIREAIFCKILQNKEITKMLCESSLPLEHYYWYTGTDGSISVLDNPQHYWQIEWIEEIREWLKVQG